MNITTITIDNIYFITIIALLTLWLTMVTTKGGLTDHRHKNWWKKITKRGWIAISIGSGIAIVLTLQEINNRRVTDYKDKILASEQNSRDSIITKGIESSTQKLFDNLSIAFKKQGLQYDTIKNQVLKLKDSIKTTIINGEPPLISLTNLQIKDSTHFIDKTYKVQYTIISHDAVSFNINFMFDIFAFTPNGNILTIKKNINIFYKGQTIAKEESLYNSLEIPKDTSFYSLYAFRLKGYYKKSDSTKIKIDKFYLLRPRTKKNYFQLPVQIHENLLRSYLFKNKMN
ncbi:hypothetical protein B6A10_11205 [Flavobacterium sp. L1I52]|uniref:Uncharacterized protein n=1 Tax=Flavobacterium pokkalii TaxID=1940408 RepID=A0ABR7UUW2_9FLAO|nr:hypothetical protein [Flavobacterium pokkalii]MBD0725749.1 hypothetical protein [Flavobacterium pokkalii]